MTTDVQGLAIIPDTGEEIVTTAPDTAIADAIAHLRDLESQCRDARALLDDELTRRMDRVAKWTRHLDDGRTITAPSPDASMEHDPKRTLDAVLELQGSGEIDAEAVDGCIHVEVKATLPYSAAQTVVPWLEGQPPEKVVKVESKLKVVALGARGISKVSAHAARVMEAAKVETGKPRRVTIKDRR